MGLPVDGHARQVEGRPPQMPLQQSPFELQPWPSVRHPEQTEMPSESREQVPPQQSWFVVHGLDVSRQVPGPRSQRPVGVSQTPEQQYMPVSLPQASPEGRHASGGMAQVPLSHQSEQQPLSSVQLPPMMAQIDPPHWPPLHASEQQSCASSQAEPSSAQKVPHDRLPRASGSHRSLQHEERSSQGAPGAEHVPDGRQ
jgi:hypothetical protein